MLKIRDLAPMAAKDFSPPCFLIFKNKQFPVAAERNFYWETKTKSSVATQGHIRHKICIFSHVILICARTNFLIYIAWYLFYTESEVPQLLSWVPLVFSRIHFLNAVTLTNIGCKVGWAHSAPRLTTPICVSLKIENSWSIYNAKDFPVRLSKFNIPICNKPSIFR